MRWTAPAAIHLTLRFLGEVPARQVADLERVVAEAAAESRALALTVLGPGAFPSPRRPRVLWLGLGGEVAGLQALAAGLERRLEPLGLAPEARPFSPHLTLGRARSPRGAPGLAAALAAPSAHAAPPVPWPADALVLFESHLEPGGARHVALARASLGGA